MPSPSSVAQSRSQRAFVAALLGALLLSLLATIRPTSAAPADVGFKDHSYDAPSVSSPTKDKPQSKVWFADGSWWGGLFVTGSNDYRIHKYNATSHTWAATSTVVDARNGSQGDYLWDGSALYVASANTDTSTGAILVFKFNYDAGSDTYTLDPDFRQDQNGDLTPDPGLIVGNGPAETVTIAKDSTGQLWVAFDNPTNPADLTQDRKVMINRSTTDEQTWGTAFQVGDNIGPDDISAIIAYGGNAVGVMMSEHRATDTESGFHFFGHPDANTDTDWAAGQSITGAALFAEDHINMKLTATSGGQILAALKTNAGPNHIQLYSRAANGTWTGHVMVGSGQDMTRPQVVVDETNEIAYVLYTSPENTGSGDQAIYYKSAPLSTLNFNAAGLGTALISRRPGHQQRLDREARGHGGERSAGHRQRRYEHVLLPRLPVAGERPHPSLHRHRRHPVRGRHRLAVGTGHHDRLHSHKFCPKDPVTRGQMATSWPGPRSAGRVG